MGRAARRGLPKARKPPRTLLQGIIFWCLDLLISAELIFRGPASPEMETKLNRPADEPGDRQPLERRERNGYNSEYFSAYS